MQWFIDLVKELIHSQLGYFDRGDPASWDFQTGDFTKDNTWRDLDLSGIIPPNVTCVLFRVVMETNLVNLALNFRTKGNVNVHNVSRSTCVVANVRKSQDVHVTPDVNGLIQYKCEPGVWAKLNVLVAGWWLR